MIILMNAITFVQELKKYMDISELAKLYILNSEYMQVE